jgi:hypothetical protein
MVEQAKGRCKDQAQQLQSHRKALADLAKEQASLLASSDLSMEEMRAQTGVRDFQSLAEQLLAQHRENPG